jgi:pyridoxamine 5'-phosphate oxidase
MTPFETFREWYSAAQESSPLKHRGAVCVSTVDAQGMPDGRVVDLKACSEAGFVFCTRFDSAKGLALAEHPYAALTFWWDHVERQIRVVGPVQRIPDAEADRYFQERSRHAQLATWASQQSAPLDECAMLEERIRKMQVKFDGASVPRPLEWGGYRVAPIRMEFLTFRATRLHERLQFLRVGDAWIRQWLQP